VGSGPLRRLDAIEGLAGISLEPTTVLLFSPPEIRTGSVSEGEKPIGLLPISPSSLAVNEKAERSRKIKNEEIGAAHISRGGPRIQVVH
jgi:hypothetical protein